MDVVAERKTDKYKKWRISVIERDNKECGACGDGTAVLHVHHIIPTVERPDLFYDLNNVVTLCHRCHFEEHHNMNIGKKGSKHSGGSYRVLLKVTVKTLAQASGRCEETVRRHIKSGRLVPSDLKSIQKWLNEKGRNGIC